MVGATSRSWRKIAGAAVALGVLAVATGVTPSGSGGHDKADAQPAGLALKQIGTFQRPVDIVHAPQRSGLLYVVEQAGTIRVVRGGRKLARPLLNIRGRVRSVRQEAGLLSVAFHPRYPSNRSFFVFYSNTEGNIQVDRFRSRPGRPARANRASRRTVIEIPHPSDSHFGGQLRFGPGGLLYMTTGDGSPGRDPEGNAQSTGALLGKLLRIKPRPKGGHRSPPANPFVGRAGRNQIYSFGLRNPWGLSFDRRTGDIWIADVGQNRWEEINHVTRAQARGANFGWNCREGLEEYERAPRTCDRVERSEFTDPVLVYPIFDRDECAVIGGHMVRGRAAPLALRGRYIHGDWCTGEIRSFRPANPPGTDAPVGLNTGFGLSSFGEGRRGAIYAASTQGPLYRIIER
jgi:glucose/arabinose dehydrogenase